MRPSLLFALPAACLALTIPSFGQLGTPSVTSNATSSSLPRLPDPVADAEWTRVSSLFKPDASTPPAKNRAEVNARVQARADAALNAARQAKAFYQRYPDHPSVGTAKKLEVLSLLYTARQGNGAVESEALAAAAALRADKTILREERFDVALAVESHKLHRQQGARPGRLSLTARENMADSLSHEFGPVPEVFGLYLGVAKQADMESANRIATKVLEMRPTPTARAAAEAITMRYSHVGHPLNLTLTTTEGERFALSSSPTASSKQQQEGFTVLYVWNRTRENSDPYAVLRRVQADLKKQANVRWVYLELGGKAADTAKTAAKAPLAGTHCYGDDTRRTGSNVIFRGITEPLAFILDGRGTLVAFSPPEDLSALISILARQR